MLFDASSRQSPAGYPPVIVGLVGAGQWAATMHAPLHSAGAETQLAGIWSAGGNSAAALAAEHGVPAFGSFKELLASCEAVDFTVGSAVTVDVERALHGQALVERAVLSFREQRRVDIAGLLLGG